MQRPPGCRLGTNHAIVSTFPGKNGGPYYFTQRKVGFAFVDFIKMELEGDGI